MTHDRYKGLHCDLYSHSSFILSGCSLLSAVTILSRSFPQARMTAVVSPANWATYLARGVPPQKRYLIGGNWKANCTVTQTRNIVNVLNKAGQFPIESETIIFPPAHHLGSVKDNVRPDIGVGSQDCALAAKPGAFTGEIPAVLLKDYGLDWVIVGHSERRAGFGGPGESDEVVAIKAKNAVDQYMKAVVCVGETLEQRDSGKTNDVVLAQLEVVNSKLSKDDWQRIVIAYEPVWAIGTGKVATPEQAQDVHAVIRAWLGKKIGTTEASLVRIIYGGSVKGASAPGLITKPDIDGFLVGGASLLPDFVTIVKACHE